MADRYVHVDVAFFHKRTCDRLFARFGYAGPLIFLALLAQVKVSTVPGRFIYESDAYAWEKLGFEGKRPDFTLAEFFTVTGRLKQTSRSRVGRVTHVQLTHYERWQKDSKRYEAAVRKSRSRRETARDISVTAVGQARDTAVTPVGPRTRSKATPKPPEENQNGKTKHPLGREWHHHDCPMCGARQPSKSALESHLEIFHPTEAEALATTADDDIPF